MGKTFVLIALVACAAAVALAAHCRPEDPSHDHCQWTNFKQRYAKRFSDKDEEKRFKTFRANLRKIDRMNREMPSAKFAVNEFADLSPAEIAKLYRNARVPVRPDEPRIEAPEPPSRARRNPSRWDATDPDKNWVTSVKNQARCGSCYAFGTAAVMEAMYKKATGAEIDLSEEQTVQCNPNVYGCISGYPESALKYFMTHGAVTEAELPYTMARWANRPGYPNIPGKDECKLAPNATGVMKVKAVNYYRWTTGEKIENLLMKFGPLMANLDSATFDFYDGGILLHSKDCAGRADHVPLLVGWGQDADGTRFWRLKNSWGPNWGEGGYVRLARDNGDKLDFNTCGIKDWGVAQIDIDIVGPHPGENSGSDSAPETFSWETGAYGVCGTACEKVRPVVCRSSKGGIADQAKCTGQARPNSTLRCTDGDCPGYSWVVGEFPKVCPKTCVMEREVKCMSTWGYEINGMYCKYYNARPESAKSCTDGECTVSALWQATEWATCDTTCQTTRKVSCVRRDGAEAPAAECDAAQRPAEASACDNGECPGYRWVAGAWGACDANCTRARTVECHSTWGTKLDESYCRYWNPRPEAEGQCEGCEAL